MFFFFFISCCGNISTSIPFLNMQLAKNGPRVLAVCSHVYLCLEISLWSWKVNCHGWKHIRQFVDNFHLIISSIIGPFVTSEVGVDSAISFSCNIGHVILCYIVTPGAGNNLWADHTFLYLKGKRNYLAVPILSLLHKTIFFFFTWN